MNAKRRRIETRSAVALETFLGIFAKYDLTAVFALRPLERQKNRRRIKTFQSGLFGGGSRAVPIYLSLRLAFISCLQKCEEHRENGTWNARRVVPEKWRAGNWDLDPLILRTRSVLIGNESRWNGASYPNTNRSPQRRSHLAWDAAGVTADCDDNVRDSARLRWL